MNGLGEFSTARMRIAASVCQLRISVETSAGSRKRNMKMRASGNSLLATPANDENQAGCDHDRNRNVAAAGVDRRRDRGRQAGIQHAFDAKAEPCNNAPQRIE